MQPPPRPSQLSSTSSVATTLSRRSLNGPPPHTRKRSTPPTLPTSSRSVTVGSDSSILQSDRSASLKRRRFSKSPSTPATLHTRKRLRVAEQECNELRRAVEREQAKVSEMRRLAEGQRAIAERLKHEGGGLELSTTDAKLRVNQLRHDVREAGAALRRRSTAGMFKAVCSTDLLFLIDTTSSMGEHIEAAKKQVMSIVNDIKAVFLNEAEVRIAVVGYKDHSDRPNIEFLDFTPSVDQVRSFLKGLKATGGADTPEDVLGGIRQALKATWRQQTRCIIHVADAPPHGSTLHDFHSSDDHYPRPGSEPHRLTHQLLLEQMIGLKLNYALLRITSRMDKMAFTFFQAYQTAAADCMLHKSNRYYRQACDMLSTGRSGLRDGSDSTRNAKAMLLFEEAGLGTTYSALRSLVVKVVTTSASCTAIRMSASTTTESSKTTAGSSKTTTGGRKTKRGGKLDKRLPAIKEHKDGVDPVQLETIAPQ